MLLFSPHFSWQGSCNLAIINHIIIIQSQPIFFVFLHFPHISFIFFGIIVAVLFTCIQLLDSSNNNKSFWSLVSLIHNIFFFSFLVNNNDNNNNWHLSPMIVESGWTLSASWVFFNHIANWKVFGTYLNEFTNWLGSDLNSVT